MALNVAEPKPIFIFYNKDTGKFEIPSTIEGNPPTVLTGGVSGYLVGMRNRIQKYVKFDDVNKVDFVLQDGEETYILPFGIETLVAKWACYMVLNNLIDLSKPIIFAISKKPESTVILPHWYQDKNPINISAETWQSFPRTTVRKTQVVDWASVLGNSDMTVVIEHTDGYIKQKLASVGITPNQHETNDNPLDEEVVLSDTTSNDLTLVF